MKQVYKLDNFSYVLTVDGLVITLNSETDTRVNLREEFDAGCEEDALERFDVLKHTVDAMYKSEHAKLNNIELTEQEEIEIAGALCELI